MAADLVALIDPLWRARAAELFTGSARAFVELRVQLRGHWRELLPFALCFFALHIVVEFGVPLFKRDAYAVFRPKSRRAAGAGAADEPAPLSRADQDAAAATDVRNKVVASAFAAYVSALSLRALLLSEPGEAERLRLDPFATSPESEHLMLVASAYFVYDVLAVMNDESDPIWLVHGALCAWVYLASLQPFLHHMGLVTLLFELSTPFYHARKALLQANLGGSALFAAVEPLFALSFVGARVVYGFYKIFAPGQWWWQIEALVEASEQGLYGGAQLHSVAVARGYQVCAVLLCALNAKWSVDILLGMRRSLSRAPARAAAGTKKIA